MPGTGAGPPTGQVRTLVWTPEVVAKQQKRGRFVKPMKAAETVAEHTFSGEAFGGQTKRGVSEALLR